MSRSGGNRSPLVVGYRLLDALSAPGEAHTAEPADTELLPLLPPVPPDPTQPITLHLDDVDIRRTLEMLSREGELSILVSPGVTGRVTANIHQLSFDEALHAILKLCDLVAYHDGASLDGLVEALQTTTDAKTLASPRVMVLNGQEARIQIGQQLGYRVITTTETASMEDVDFLEVGVVLTVTPHISRDNQVVMQVKPKVSTGRIDQTTALPEEETTEVETSILLTDGRGMVIGGLIQEEDIDEQSKVPLLGDLWYIGRLFQRRTVKKVRSEIIITLKPRVLLYMPDYECIDRVETQRASTPLLYGPLCKYPRPWEPALPDAIHDPRPGTIPPRSFEYCGRPDGQCLCGRCP